MELFRKQEPSSPSDIAEGAALAEEILKQLQEERLNGAEKKKNKATKKNKAKKSSQGKKE